MGNKSRLIKFYHEEFCKEKDILYHSNKNIDVKCFYINDKIV